MYCLTNSANSKNMNGPMTTMPTPMLMPMHQTPNNVNFQITSVTGAASNGMPMLIQNNYKASKASATSKQMPEMPQFVPDVDLPEMLFVETRFISLSKAVQASFAAQTNDNVSCVTLSTSDIDTAKPTTSNAETLTDNPNPTRERSQQTEDVSMNTQSIGIQCNLKADEFDFHDFNDFNNKPVNNIDKSETDFVQFIIDRSWQHSNGKCECLICGEIGVNAQAMAHHLAYHWGPPALCSACGRNFEHVREFNKHRCEMRRGSKRRHTQTPYALHCPYYRCNVTAISRLELYDHVNEHSAQCSYNCSKCQRNFPTACELWQHIRCRRACRDARKRLPYPRRLFDSKRDTAYRVRVRHVYTLRKRRICFKSFLSFAMRSRHMRHGNSLWRCQLCMKRSTNEFMHARHFQRCFQDYQYRLQRKRENLIFP